MSAPLALAALSILLAGEAVPVAGAGAAATADRTAPPSVVVDALRAEMDRAMAALRTEGFDKPYYASASVLERRGVVQEAAAGGLLPLREGRQRWLRVVVRVGGYDLDNSGFVDQMGGRGTGEVTTGFPLDDDPMAMRRTLWLAFDGAYKEAGATHAAKRAFLASQGENTKESFGDFTRESARRSFEALPSLAGDRDQLAPLVRNLAAGLVGADQPASRLRVSLVERSTIFIDTEGSDLRTGSTFAAFEAAAWSDAADGQPVRDLIMRYGATLAALGTPESMAAELTEMLASVRAQAAAPALADSYNGPLLLEGDASAQVLSSILMPRITQPREPVSASGGGGGGAAGAWGARTGSRVIATSLSVADDPTLAQRGGVALVGGYRFDFEGILAKPVTLITNGVLKDFVGTRWPRKGALQSNGHARRIGGAAWNLGAIALPSNLLVTAGEEAQAADAVRARFLAEIKARELTFGLLVRRLDDSSILQLGATDWLEVGDLQGRVHEDSDIEMPVRVFKVFPDGREERVRGVRFGRVPPEALKNVLAVTGPSDSEAVFNALLTFDLGYTLSGPVNSSFLPLSVVAPGLTLLEEVEMKPISGSFPKKPLAAARMKAATAKPARR